MGQAGKPVEFGIKLDISVADGWSWLEHHSFDANNEPIKLQKAVDRFLEREGHYPGQILADKIYRTRDNLRYCRKHNIRLSGPALGRPKKDEARDKKPDYLDKCDRVEVERRFSLAKRKCGLGPIATKLEQTIAHTVAMSILVLNPRKIQCALFEFLAWLLWKVEPYKKWKLFRRHYCICLFCSNSVRNLGFELIL